MWGRKRIAIGLSVALLATLSITGLVLASQPPTPTPGAGTGKPNYGEVFLDKLAGILHVDRGVLTQAMKDAGKQTADQAVKDGNLTQDRANQLKDRIDKAQGFGFLRPGFGGFGKGHGPGRGNGPKAPLDQQLMQDLRNAERAALANLLGMTVDKLPANPRDLRQAMQDKGLTQGQVQKAIADAETPIIDKAVADGKLTQDQANMLKQHLGRGVPFGMLPGMPFGKGQPQKGPTT